MATIHVSRSGATLGTFDEEKVREGLRTGEFIGTDLGWMEGMPTWRPLSELDDFGKTPEPAAASAPTPEPQPSSAAAPEGATVLSAPGTTTGERTGLPWEHRERVGWFNALVETVQMMLMRPAEAFGVLRREGGLMDPLLYAVILGMIGAVVSYIFSFGLQAVGIGASKGMGAMFGMGAMSFMMLILMPFIIVISTFIFAAIIHLVLMLLSGAKQPFEATVRVVCYSSGSANLLQVVPICGGLLALVYSLVLNSMGMARVHETDTWKATVAVLSPVILCCGGAVVFAMLMGGLAAAGANWR